MLRYDIETIVKLIGEKNASYRSLLPTDDPISLVRANLRFGVLGGIDLSNIMAVEVNFSNASMNGINLSDSNLLKANCRGANFTLGVLVGANFNQAILEGADFDYADISGANFENAQGLTQEQLDSAVYTQGNPPKNLQHPLRAPTRTPQDVNHPYSKN